MLCITNRFEAAASISTILQNAQCATVEHMDKQASQDPGFPKVKVILSAAFEKELGGIKNVVELVKRRGAKSLAIIEENADNFGVERLMNGALLRLASKQIIPLKNSFCLI